MQLKGGCLCGQVRFEITGEHKGTCICHCRSCQKATGATNFAVIVVAKDDLLVQGQLKCHSDPGASGEPVHRFFCPECGTKVMGHPAVMGDLRTVSACALDDPSQVTMGMEIWLDDAQSWDQALQHTVCFQRNPQ